MKCLLLERKTVASKLLSNRAGALTHMPSHQIFQSRPHHPEKIVAPMLIKLCVLDGYDGVDQIARQLFVRNGLAVLDVDLAKDLIVSIDNYTGGFHLLQFAEIERGCFSSEISTDNGKINHQSGNEYSNNRYRNVEPRAAIPRAPQTITWRRDEMDRVCFH